MKFTFIDCYTSGGSNLKYHKGDSLTQHQKKRKKCSKKAKEIISHIPKDFTVAVEDESIFIHDALIRRMWTPKGKRPIVLTSGSHQKTCVFGALCIDGRQFFRQYSTFNQDMFLRYLKELQRKFRKLILFLDRAAQHYRSSKVRKHLEGRKGVIRVEYLPKGSPGLSDR